MTFSHHTSSQFCKAQRFSRVAPAIFKRATEKENANLFYLLVLFLELSARCGASSRRSCGNVTFGADVSVFCIKRSVSSVTTEHEDGQSTRKKKKGKQWKNRSNLGFSGFSIVTFLFFLVLFPSSCSVVTLDTLRLIQKTSTSTPNMTFPQLRRDDAPHRPDSSRKSTSR